MCDIPEIPVAGFSARHRNKQSLFPFDHFDIMYDKFIIDCDRYHGFHLAFFFHLADSNVCNLPESLTGKKDMISQKMTEHGMKLKKWDVLLLEEHL